MSPSFILQPFRARRTRGALLVAVTAILALTVGAPPAFASTSLRSTDFNGDGISDIAGINNDNKCMYEWYGNGNGGFDSAVQKGCGWEGYTLVSPGDLNTDGYADLLGVNVHDGCLYEWLSAGGAGFNTATRLLCGINNGISVTSAGDMNGDGRPDIVVFDRVNDCMQSLFGVGTGGFSPGPQTCSGGPVDFTGIVTLEGVGDLGVDGKADLIGINKLTGCLEYFLGDGRGGIMASTNSGCGWGDYLDPFSLGDLNSDGFGDLLAIKRTTGQLYRWYNSGFGNFDVGTPIGTGWGSIVPGA